MTATKLLTSRWFEPLDCTLNASDVSAQLLQIEQLSAQNRGERSPALAEQIVQLRQELAAGMLASKPASSIPHAPGPDLFATGTTLPEIPAAELDATRLACGILQHGALLVRGLFQPTQVAHLLEHLEGMAAAPPADTPASHVDMPALGCSPSTLFELLEIYRQCGLLGTVKNYLGGEALLFAERAKLRRHTAERDSYAAIPWHQDINFFGSKAYAVNCWVAITPCGTDNPGLALIPRRTEQRHGWNSEELAPLDYGKRLPAGMIEQLSRDHPVVTPVFEAGDAILFDEMTIHTTAPRPWQVAQQVVAISWFFPAARFPAWGTPLAV